MHKMFKNYLKFIVYKEQSRQLISAASKQKRNDSGKQMLRAVDHFFICTDEKILTVEAVINTENDILHAHDAGDLAECSRTH